MMTMFHYISLPEWIWWYANIIDLIHSYLVDFPCTSASDQISVADNSTGTAHPGRKKPTPLIPALILRVIWMVLMHCVWKPGPAKRTEWLSWLIMYPRLSERMRWLSVSGSFTYSYSWGWFTGKVIHRHFNCWAEGQKLCWFCRIVQLMPCRVRSALW